MTSRIARGFHRIGIVLAVPLLLLAVGVAGHETWLQWTTKDPWAAFPTVQPAPKKSSNPFDQFDLPSDVAAAQAAQAAQAAPAYRANYAMASIILAFAVALYVAARVVGWVLDGFMGQGSRT